MREPRARQATKALAGVFWKRVLLMHRRPLNELLSLPDDRVHQVALSPQKSTKSNGERDGLDPETK